MINIADLKQDPFSVAPVPQCEPESAELWSPNQNHSVKSNIKYFSRKLAQQGQAASMAFAKHRFVL